MNLREAPLMYAGAMANLEMELRIRTVELPAGESPRWLDVEVQTAKTRPAGTVLWSNRRTDGEFTIIPVIQGPLFRSGNRVIVVRIDGRQDEAFMPRMKRTPDPKADWSEWFARNPSTRPMVSKPPTPPKPVFELRYRVPVRRVAARSGRSCRGRSGSSRRHLPCSADQQREGRQADQHHQRSSEGGRGGCTGSPSRRHSLACGRGRCAPSRC
jgi:hypothetical protein